MTSHRARALSLCLAFALPMGCASGGGTPAPAGARTASDADAELRWEGWKRQAFERAARDRKLLLVSVQASWCHWCHVMNEVTYTDTHVVELLSEHFVAIKVDADARPDLAERYRDYAWPATAILTPDAQPVTAIRGHRPPHRFAKLLRTVVRDFEAGKPIAEQPPEIDPDPELAELASLRDFVRAQLDARYDAEDGGWGEPQKYPLSAPVEHALLMARLAGLRGDEGASASWRARSVQTLRGHAQLIDPVWGGMYQYSLEDRWDAPHFEKIVPIQAGAIDNFVEAHRLTAERVWLDRALAVHRYVTEHLRAPEGGFYTSQDADLRTGDVMMTGDEYYALGDGARHDAGIPRIDENVYANRNGMLIAALADLYAATLDEAVLSHAVDAAERIERTHRRGTGGYAHGAGDGGEVLHLSDQAWMARGLLALHRVTGDDRWLDRAERTLRFVRDELTDDDGGLFAHTPDPAARGVFADRRKPLEAGGVAARAMITLERLRGGGVWGEAARGALRALADRELIRDHGRKVGHYLLALELAQAPYVLLSVVGPDDRPETRKLHRAALAFYDPLRLVELGRPGASRYPYPGKPAVYMCTQDACSMPIHDPAQIAPAARRFMERAPLGATAPNRSAVGR